MPDGQAHTLKAHLLSVLTSPTILFQTLGSLNLTGFTGPKYEEGVPVRDVKERLRGTPYELYGWQAGREKKRGSDGSERRNLISLTDIIVAESIVVAEAVIDPPDGSPRDKHALVWDGWRGLLFVGPGRHADDRSADGIIKVEKDDMVRALR